MLYHAVNISSGRLRIEKSGFPWAQPQSAPEILVGYRSHAILRASMRILAILALSGFRLEAQSAIVIKLVIVKKPGAPDGQAMATVKAPHQSQG
jgi:hypothetical protein